jgi:hypothetical protein
MPDIGKALGTASGRGVPPGEVDKTLGAWAHLRLESMRAAPGNEP